MSGDRPRRSWKEIDATRDRGSGRSSRPDPDEKRKTAQAASQAYRAYKSQLDKLFTPGGAALPPALAEKLGPATETQKAERDRLEALKAEPNEANLRAVVEAGIGLPGDPRVLMSLLDVRDGELVRTVLNRMLTMIEDEGKKPNKALATQRIDALVLRTDDKELKDLALTVRACLG